MTNVRPIDEKSNTRPHLLIIHGIPPLVLLFFLLQVFLGVLDPATALAADESGDWSGIPRLEESGEWAGARQCILSH